MATVSAVVFDWYGTLAAPNDDDFWVRLPQIIVGAGGRPVAEALREWERDHPLDHREHSSTEDAYRLWQRHRIDQLLHRCMIGEPSRSRVVEEIEQVRYSRLFKVFPEVSAVLRALRDRGLVVGVCSNWDWDLGRHLDHNGIAGLFDFVISSASAGYRKPHRAIFDVVLAEAGVPAEEVIFVGDSWDDDVRGAASAGLRPVHVARPGPCDRDDHGAVACVPDLSPLATMVEPSRR
jgi:putative hydrolase of the HAD superfamily